MKVNFDSITPISTVDWHGRSVCTIFLNGCTFSCKYCQNYKLIKANRWTDIVDIEKDILDSKMLVSAVVFSGGEPTLQRNILMRLAKFAKDNGLYIGIQTNGYYPDVLQDLVNEKLIDKIFLDIKAPLNEKDYREITGYDVIIDRIIRSLNIRADKEIRTTIFRSNYKKVKDIIKYLNDNNKYIGYDGQIDYVIQQGLPWNTSDDEIRKEDILKRNEILEFARELNKNMGNINIKIRTVEKGDENVAAI